jgi:hypothetical protein
MNAFWEDPWLAFAGVLGMFTPVWLNLSNHQYYFVYISRHITQNVIMSLAGGPKHNPKSTHIIRWLPGVTYSVLNLLLPTCSDN